MMWKKKIGEMMDNKIKSIYLNKYLCRLFNSDSIGEKDLYKVKRLVINSNELSENEKDEVMDDLKLFNNLKDISLTLFSIKQKDIDILKSINSLKSITFDFCKLNCSLDGEFTNIVFNNCSGIQLNEIVMENLKELKIIGLNEKLDLKNILKCKNLEELFLLNCDVLNICEVLKFEKLKKLNISGSNIEHDNIILLCEKIQVIYEKEYHPTGV